MCIVNSVLCHTLTCMYCEMFVFPMQANIRSLMGKFYAHGFKDAVSLHAVLEKIDADM